MRRRQQGISYIGVMILIAIAGVILKVTTVVAPPYLEYMTIDKAIKAMLRDPQADNMSVADAKSGLSTRFEVNNVTDQKPEDFVYTKDGNKLVIDLDYEVRRHLGANIDVVIHFKNTYTSELKPGNE